MTTIDCAPAGHQRVLLVAESTTRWMEWLDALRGRAARVDAVIQGPQESLKTFAVRVRRHVIANGAGQHAVLVSGGPWHTGALRARVDALQEIVASLDQHGGGELEIACDAIHERAHLVGVRALADVLEEHGAGRGVKVTCRMFDAGELAFELAKGEAA